MAILILISILNTLAEYSHKYATICSSTKLDFEKLYLRPNYAYAQGQPRKNNSKRFCPKALELKKKKKKRNY